MPDIDLGPNDYRKRDPKTGKWVNPMDRKMAIAGAIGCAAILAFIYWTRDEGSRASLFGAAVLFAFAGGLLFASWLTERQR